MKQTRNDKYGVQNYFPQTDIRMQRINLLFGLSKTAVEFFLSSLGKIEVAPCQAVFSPFVYCTLEEVSSLSCSSLEGTIKSSVRHTQSIMQILLLGVLQSATAILWTLMSLSSGQRFSVEESASLVGPPVGFPRNSQSSRVFGWREKGVGPETLAN